MYRGVREVDTDLPVVAHPVLRLGERLLRVVDLLDVVAAQLARRFLGGPLAHAHDDLGLALVLEHLLAVARATIQLDLRLDQFAALLADIAARVAHGGEHGLLLRLDRLLVVAEVAAEQPDSPVAEFGDRVDRSEQIAVVAHEQDGAGELSDRGVEQAAAGAVEVVGRFVEQQDVRLTQQLCGEPEQRGLATGQFADRPIQMGDVGDDAS